MAQNGNKPQVKLLSDFTKRIAKHPRISYYADPRCGTLVFMVIDELLVTKAAIDNKKNTDLYSHLNSTAKPVGSVLDAHSEDEVQVWRLHRTPGNGSVPDVASAVWDARKLLSTPKDAAQIAPNHVLVPAPNYHSCPYGPPYSLKPTVAPPSLGHAGSNVRVTVIDSGYVPGGPIDARLESARYGSWFTETAAGGYGWMQEGDAYPGTDPLDQNGDSRLDALVGHANFVAGVVASMCPTAIIDVVSHNGSFVNNDDGNPPDTPLPTEAAVARSLWETLNDNNRWSDVINVGFAFPTLPYTPPVGAPADGPPSWTFKAILDMFEDEREFYLVAPAGNQNCTIPQYPAAFAGTHSNVIGVGSITGQHPNWRRSGFSNHGGWVVCCTTGEEVVSSFITDWVSKPTEEADPRPMIPRFLWPHPKKTFEGWARWTGTSFAAPKIAGLLAEEKRKSGTSLQASWGTLRATLGGAPGALEMGIPITA